MATHNLSDRIKARADQLGYTVAQVAELAGLNRSFIYDIIRGKSEKPNLQRLDLVARALRVERSWLQYGQGEVEGESPVYENPDLAFVAIPYVHVRPSMGGGQHLDMEPDYGRPYHFQRSWIRQSLKTEPTNLRIMHVEGDSMVPTLNSGDIVLVDAGRRTPTPPGIFVLYDGLGLVAKRLEYIPNSDPPQVRIVSDNSYYPPYERLIDETNIVGRIRWVAREM